MNENKTNFMQVIPNSQFFSDLDQIIAHLTFSQEIDKEYLLIALTNTKNQGYRLVKDDNKTIN